MVLGHGRVYIRCHTRVHRRAVKVHDRLDGALLRDHFVQVEDTRRRVFQMLARPVQHLQRGAAAAGADFEGDRSQLQTCWRSARRKRRILGGARVFAVEWQAHSVGRQDDARSHLQRIEAKAATENRPGRQRRSPRGSNCLCLVLPTVPLKVRRTSQSLL